MAVLVRERVGPPERVSCRSTGALPGASGSRFSCRAGSERYRVEWEHYGTGRYEIAVVEADGASRTVARGTLSISE